MIECSHLWLSTMGSQELQIFHFSISTAFHNTVQHLKKILCVVWSFISTDNFYIILHEVVELSGNDQGQGAKSS